MARKQDPFGSYNFHIELDGVTAFGFKECSGLEATLSPVKYREGTDTSLAPRQLSGLVSTSNLVLKRGVTDDAACYEWFSRGMRGELERRDISVVLRDVKGAEKLRWNVRQAWPTKWVGPSLDAANDAIAIESLELVHEGIEVAK